MTKRLSLGIACTALALACASHALAAGSAADKAFVGKVSQGGLYEVLASRLAIRAAAAPDVRDLATAEVHDHTLVNRELKRIATGDGIAIAPGLSPEFRQRLAKLKSTVGPGFDAAYLADMQQIHAKDEKLFAQEAIDGSGGFRGFAHRTDLIVKRHIGALHGLDK